VSAPPSSPASERPAARAHVAHAVAVRLARRSHDQLAVLERGRLDVELRLLAATSRRLSARKPSSCCLRLVELHAEHPVDAALQVEAEPQTLVGQQRARDARRLGREVREREEREEDHREQPPRIRQRSWLMTRRPSCPSSPIPPSRARPSRGPTRRS
jgi:hypothetical protein